MGIYSVFGAKLLSYDIGSRLELCSDSQNMGSALGVSNPWIASCMKLVFDEV